MILIIGGGIQGCFFAIALQHELGYSPDDIRIFDPHPGLLDAWLSRTAACGMNFLRSNSSHSIHVDFHSLRTYARHEGIDLWNGKEFAMPYHRPSLELFNRHAGAMIREYQLENCHIQERVTSIDPSGGVHTDTGSYRGTVIYAGGFDHGGLRYPRNISRIDDRNHHVFDPRHMENPAEIPGHTRIIGGGISALQLAISLARRNAHPVLITRRPLEVFRFDFDPCYIGPKCLPGLDKVETEPGGEEQRINEIIQGRFSGTIPSEIFQRYREALTRGSLRHEIIPDFPADQLEEPAGGGHRIFCTGFHTADTRHPLLEELQQKGRSHSDQSWSQDRVQRRTIHGYPVVGRDLRWGTGLFLSGSAAMYRLGPSAPNIIGAHLAWRIIRKHIPPRVD